MTKNKLLVALSYSKDVHLKLYYFKRLRQCFQNKNKKKNTEEYYLKKKHTQKENLT